jgi:hypothetical protein
MDSPFLLIVPWWAAGFTAAGAFHFLAYAWSGGEFADFWASPD